MKRIVLLLSLIFSLPVFAKVETWYGKYKYEGSEEIVAGNVATMEIELKLTSKTCDFNVSGFQVYEKYKCRANEKNGFLYIYDQKNHKELGRVVRKNKKYYIYSDDVLDPKDIVKPSNFSYKYQKII